MQAENNYCAFIDVLGYGNIVASKTLSTEEKVKIFESIYMNLFQSISQTTKQYNHNNTHKLFIKSFSDSVFFESKDPLPILFSLYNIFNRTFCYYSNFSFEKQYTPLLRSGIAYDWTIKIMDTASLSRQDINSMPGNEEYQNIVGLGIAKAYYVSEKSKLSGMRIIIESDALKQLKLIPYTKVPFECFCIDCPNYLYDKRLQHDLKEFKLFFTPIRKNEDDKEIDCYEICWPVFTYSHNANKSDIGDHIAELYKMEHTFTGDAVRHHKKTAEIIYKSLLITIQEFENVFTTESIDPTILELQRISGIKL